MAAKVEPRAATARQGLGLWGFIEIVKAGGARAGLEIEGTGGSTRTKTRMLFLFIS